MDRYKRENGVLLTQLDRAHKQIQQLKKENAKKKIRSAEDEFENDELFEQVHKLREINKANERKMFKIQQDYEAKLHQEKVKTMRLEQKFALNEIQEEYDLIMH